MIVFNTHRKKIIMCALKKIGEPGDEAVKLQS
jgi:hypothetical protein